ALRHQARPHDLPGGADLPRPLRGRVRGPRRPEARRAGPPDEPAEPGPRAAAEPLPVSGCESRAIAAPEPRGPRLPAVRPPCRLHVLLAREAPVAVILRRGPSAWYQVILWRTDRDTFEDGAWFKGRLYEERCDLSPDGELLLYFALQGSRW